MLAPLSGIASYLKGIYIFSQQALGEADYLNPAVAEAITVNIMSSIADAASAYAEAMNTAQERFGAKLAHDMRSPLTAAKICAERIAMRP